MKCYECDNKSEIKPVAVDMPYVSGGLEHFFLSGVKKYTCLKCGNVEFNFGNLEQLNELIAEILVRKDSPLDAKEFRFLRKYLGYSTEVFGDLIGYARETISRMETGKQDIPKVLDTALRAIVMAMVPNRDYSLHNPLAEKIKTPKSIQMTIDKKSKWTSVHFAPAL